MFSREFYSVLCYKQLLFSKFMTQHLQLFILKQRRQSILICSSLALYWESITTFYFRYILCLAEHQYFQKAIHVQKKKNLCAQLSCLILELKRNRVNLRQICDERGKIVYQLIYFLLFASRMRCLI